MYEVVLEAPRHGPRVVGHMHTYKGAASLVARLARDIGPFHTLLIQKRAEVKTKQHA